MGPAPARMSILTLAPLTCKSSVPPKGFTLKGLDIYGDITQPLVYFINNTGNLTLTDLVINNADTTNRDGLLITSHTGNVSLNMVKADNNGGEGAYISGVTGSVSVTNSSFNNNGSGSPGHGESSLNRRFHRCDHPQRGLRQLFPRGNGATLKSSTGITVKNSLFQLQP